MVRRLLLFLGLGISLLSADPAKSLVPHGGGAGTTPACGPDPAPGPAAAHGFTCETFVDNFTSLSTIDTTNTLAPGFNWYVNNGWPGEAGGNTQWRGQVPTLSDSYSIGVGGLTFNVPRAEYNRVYVGGGAVLTTCAYKVGGGYVGTAFTNGWYSDVYMASYSGRGNEFLSWYLPTEYYTSTSTGTLFDEIDNSGNNAHTAIIEWLSGATNVQQGGQSYDNFHNVPHTYGQLVVPAVQNGGRSLLANYVDEVVHTSLTYPATGLFSTVAKEHYCILLNSNSGIIGTFGSVKVWQLPP
jgi:hypothetical protein